MKRSSKLALSLVLAAGMVAPAFAQDNFPDVPANHWAYEALARMKRDGLLVGYPDGLYRGGRPASRYELAVAMHAVYTNLKNVTDGLDAQIRALQAPNPDIQALKDAVAALQADLAAMRGYGDDIAALKRAAETFDRELKSLGVDVEAMKKDLLDLSGRVSALENKKPSIEISGDVNLLLLAGNSSGDAPGLSMDGRLEGVKNNGSALGEVGGGGNTGRGTTVGLQGDVSVLHEAAFTFAGTNASGVKFTGTAVIGNMTSDNGFGGGTGDSFGSQSVLPAGRYNDGVADDIYIQNLQASFDTKLLGVGAVGFQIGRIGKSVDPWSFQRIDNTSYYSNERWDNGKYALDGVNADFKLFGSKVEAFGGRTSERYTLNGVDLNQVVLGNNRVAGGGIIATSDELVNVPDALTNFDVDRILGLQSSFALFKAVNINLSYLWMDSDNDAALFNTPDLTNRLEVYGGDASFSFSRFKLSGSYHQNDLKNNDRRVVGDDNEAFDGKVAFVSGHYNLYAKYHEIQDNYVAPGDWGRLGILRNVAGVQGFQFGGSFNINNKLVLSGSGETDRGLSEGGEIVPQVFDGGSKIYNWAARLDYKFSPNVSLYGSYESTDFKGLTAITNNPGETSRYRFATVGLGYGLSERAKLNVSYQVSDVVNEAFLPALNGGTNYKGGLLTTQLTVKF